MRRTPIALVVACSVVLLASSAHAQQPAPKPPTSEADRLFEEALSLLDAGKYDEACAKFDASHRVDPAPGTLLSLGDCYAKAGKTASAWRSFREAAEFARRIGDPERTRVATERGAAIEPSLAKLTIVVEKSGAAVTVRRSGTVVEPTLWGVPVPLDPASYTIEATAPGRQPWSSTVELREGQKTVTVPALPLPAPAVAAPPTTQPEQRPFFTTRKTVATGVGAVGLIAIGVGSFLGLGASSKWNDARSRFIDGEPLRCSDPAAADEARSAGSQADVATVTVTVGLVALGAAVVLWLTD
jgi:tetratricopeptide (TPR) repeat protein